MTDEAESLLASQRLYYDERADDYGDVTKPDRRVPGLMTLEQSGTLIDRFRPTGDVLELACGTGGFTRDIVRRARSVTAVDASPHMLAINAQRVGDPKVTYVHADLFAWEADRAYDAVFFGFWLSHVPPSSFDDFWTLVRRCLAPGGRVGFVDEDDRGSVHDDVRPVGGIPATRRRLADGREFEIVKLFWRPEDLEMRLRSAGWDITVRPFGKTYLYGVGT